MPITSFRRWVVDHPGIASGGFASAVFLIVGGAGLVAASSGLREWSASRTWPTTEATIASGRLVHAVGSRLSRAEFTYRYTWNGEAHTTSGYALLDGYMTTSIVRSRLAALPAGSRTTVFVNPSRPSQAVLIRAESSTVLLYFVIPAVFVLLGLVGTFFTAAGWLGWLDAQSRHPVGRAARSVGGVLLREGVLKAVFYTVMFAVIGGIVAGGIIWGNALLVLVGAVMLWTLWRATRTQKS